jgi:hypothetical protein
VAECRRAALYRRPARTGCCAGAKRDLIQHRGGAGLPLNIMAQLGCCRRRACGRRARGIAPAAPRRALTEAAELARNFRPRDSDAERAPCPAADLNRLNAPRT